MAVSVSAAINEPIRADSPLGPTPSASVLPGSFSKVIMGHVEIPAGAVEHNDVEIWILLDEAVEVAEDGYGSRRDRVH